MKTTIKLTAYYGIYDEGDLWTTDDGAEFPKSIWSLEEVAAIYR